MESNCCVKFADGSKQIFTSTIGLRIVDEQEVRMEQRKRELEAQHKIELEAKHKRELDAKNKRELEAKQKRELDTRLKLNSERSSSFSDIYWGTELDARLKQNSERLEAQRQREIEAKRKIELEAQRERELELKKQREEQRAKKQIRQEALSKLRDVLENDFLNADTYFENECSGVITRKEYEHARIDFVQSWQEKHWGIKLDSQQAASIAATSGNIQVVARAGSGKTSTLVNRAAFLQRHCGAAPNEMLLLAFNKDAAKEMSERLKKMLDGNIPHTMTFHALAYAIVHPKESILFNGPQDENQGLNSAFQDVIDDHLAVPEHRAQIRALMLAHFREDWERIVTGFFDKGKEELIQFRRSLPRRSMGGDFVKSFGEKVIADFLFEHDVKYLYEQNIMWNGINYRPDFTIYKSKTAGVVIEYFGMNGDPDYDSMMFKKYDYWERRPTWTLLDFKPDNISRNGVDKFRETLKEALESAGINCRRLSEDEIWLLLRERAIDNFTKASVGFVGRCRKRFLLPAELEELIKLHTPLSPVERMFLKIAQKLYAAYLERLNATGEEDFDGLMQRAINSIANGQTIFERTSERGDLKKLRYILVDEFQDFSELFSRLLGALRVQNTEAEFFCVGDDWQAINGFAGSDLKFYKGYSDYFAPSQQLNISTNYRSSRLIVETGNALMEGLGLPAKTYRESVGRVLVADLSEFKPTLLEEEEHANDIITPSVLRIAGKFLKEGQNVVLLSRSNSLPYYIKFKDHDTASNIGLDKFLSLIRSYLPKELRNQITISTAHKYKGLQKQVVIVLDAVDKKYPLIHPDWVFTNIFGDSPQKITAEERRLFYVALTRAVDTLVIVTENGRYSPFLVDIQNQVTLPKINWPEYSPISGLTKSLTVKVGCQNFKGSTPTFAIKEFLKAEHYNFRTTEWTCWAKSFPTDGFSVETLKASLWAKEANGVEVRIFDDCDKHIATYLIDSGQWRCTFDHLTEVCEVEIIDDGDIPF